MKRNVKKENKKESKETKMKSGEKIICNSNATTD